MSHMHWPYLCQNQEADETFASWAREQNVLYLLAFPTSFRSQLISCTNWLLTTVDRKRIKLNKKETKNKPYLYQQGPSVTKVE